MPNLAFISAAHVHTGAYIDRIRANADHQRVHAIWDDDPDRGRRFAAHADAVFVDSLDAVLSDPAIDGFVIAAENSRHFELLVQILPVGKPTFCEKPLVSSTHEAKALRELLRLHPTPLVCGYFHPFSEDMLAVAGMLSHNAFGRVMRATFRNAHNGAFAHWFDSKFVSWLRRPDLAIGGGFLDMGTHAVHLLRVLFGPVRAVWADIRNESGIYPGIDDFGVAHLRFESGLSATVEAGWTQTGGMQGLEIAGSFSSLWNTATGYVVGSPGSDPRPLPVSAPEEPSRIDRLVAVINGEISPAVLREEIDTALETVAIMDACYTASRERRWTEVAESPAT